MANFKNKQVVKSLKMKKKLSNNEIQSKLTFNKNLNNISNVLISVISSFFSFKNK